jgi:hypothetical protein
MKKQEAFKEILHAWEKRPDSERVTEKQAATFALCIIQDRPELKNFSAIGDPYQHIKAFLCSHLVHPAV